MFSHRPSSIVHRPSSIMLIGIDGIPLGTPKAGIGHYTFELARTLAALDPASEYELISPPMTVAPDVAAEGEPPLPPNLQTIYRQADRLLKHWWTIGLPLYVRRRGLHLFHGTNYSVPLWNRCPTVVTIHDLSLLLHSATHEEHLVRRARLRLPIMVRTATKIISDSASVKREICEHLGVREEKIAVVPLAPRRTFRPIAAAEGAGVLRRLGVESEFILFVGTVEPRKNLLTLVRAFAELLRHTDARPQLVIAGQKGWLTDDLFALVEQSAGLKERILFTGYVSDEDLRALYSACRVCVYPSLYEGFGLPPLEAMACGAPVIASRIPVIIETVGTAARLFDPMDAEALAQSLVEVLSNEDEREGLSQIGMEQAAQFTWERTALSTLDVYREVLRETKTQAAAQGVRSRHIQE